MRPIDESDNKAVFTTRYVVKNGSPILHVFYDEDGDWQFLGAEEIDESDAMIVSIKEIIEHDDSLRNVPNLKFNQSAVRENAHSSWRIERNF